VAQAKPGREDELMPTAAQEWVQQGRAEGRALGKMEGKAEARIDAILAVLESRFGPLSSDVNERIRREPQDALDALLRRAATAPAVDAVFEAAPHH
jgi:hypothetical protein